MQKDTMTQEEYEEYLDEVDFDEDDEIELEENERDEDMEEDGSETFENAKNFYRYDNGNRFFNPSKIFGTLAGIVAVVAHVIHTFVSNVLFDKYEQLAIREAFMRGLGKLGEYGEISADEADKATTKQETESQEKKITLKEAEIPNDTAKRVEPVAENLHTDLNIVHEALKNPSIQHIFAMNGYLTDIPDLNKDEAYFFEYKNGSVNNEGKGFPASDLLTGSGSNMLHAIQELETINSLEAALKSTAIISAMVVTAAQHDKMDLNDILKDNLIGFADYKTQYGSNTVEFLLNNENKQQVDIYFNGNKIHNIELEKICKEPFDNYKENILNAINLETRKEANICNELKIVWDNINNEVSLYQISNQNSEIGTFRFETQEDVMRIAEILKEKNIYPLYQKGEENIPLQPEAIAYTIGALTNPEMKLMRTNDKCINPLTGNCEPDGKAHIYTTCNECGVEIHAFLPAKDKNDSFRLCGFTSRDVLSDASICEIITCVQDTVAVLENMEIVDDTYNRDEEIHKNAVVPEEKDIDASNLKELNNKCIREVNYENSNILSQTMAQKNSNIVTPLSELFENRKESNMAKEGCHSDAIPEWEEESIENTSIFVPAFDDEER